MPDFLGILAVEVIDRPAVHRAGKVILAHRGDQIAIRHPQDLQIEPLEVHRLHRHAIVGPARQDIGPAGEADRGRPIPHIGGDRHILAQRFPRCRRQALAEGQRVTAAVFHPADTDLVRLGLDRKPGFGQLHEGRVIHPALHQIGVEIRADPGACAVSLDRVIGDAEAVFALGLLQRGGDILARGERRGQLQRRQRLAGAVGLFQRLRQNEQRLGLTGGLGRAQITVHRRRNRPADRLGLLQPQAQRRVIRPQVRGIGEHDHRALQGLRPRPVRLRPGLFQTRGQFLGAGEIRQMQPPHRRGQRRRLGQAARGQELQIPGPGLRPRLGALGRRHHHAREGALIGRHRRHPGFREAGIVAGVEGHRLAGRIGQTGSLASFKAGVENLFQIAAGQVHAFGDRQPSFWNKGGLLRQQGGRAANHCTQGKKGRGQTHGNLRAECADRLMPKGFIQRGSKQVKAVKAIFTEG